MAAPNTGKAHCTMAAIPRNPCCNAIPASTRRSEALQHRLCVAACTPDKAPAPLYPHPSHNRPNPQGPPVPPSQPPPLFLFHHQAANLAAVAFFLVAPSDPRAEAAAYTLCEGPLAAALIAWQCAWLLGSPDHAIRWGRGGERKYY